MEYDIYSLRDYVSVITNSVFGDVNGVKYYKWFRGHADKEWELIPKVQREYNGSSNEELHRLERRYVNDYFTRASHLQHNTPPADDYSGWLALMQHYGLPTRLLDWSRSPLVALYFAVCNEKEWDKDGCIWVLIPDILNRVEELEKPSRVDDREYENTYLYNSSHRTIQVMVYSAFKRWNLDGDDPNAITPEDRKFDRRYKALSDKIAACYPVWPDLRIYNQLSTFTVHSGLQKLREKNESCGGTFLDCICIPAESKKRLRFELELCGITESYIFPDLEHLANELKNRQN